MADIVRGGGVIVYPTDSSFALGWQPGNRDGLDRVRAIRNLDDRHHFTLVCHDFAQLGQYVQLNNATFRLVKAATPGPYTFILRATKEVPKRLLHPKKHTVGVRILADRVAHALLTELGEPMVSSSVWLPGDQEPMTVGWEIKERLDHQVDAVLDAGDRTGGATTIVDLSEDEPEVIRVGVGDPARFQ